MKNLKKLFVFALVAIMAFSLVACEDNEPDEGKIQATPRPTPQQKIVNLSAEQMNNYYVAYNVTKQVTQQSETGEWVSADKTVENVEVAFSSVILSSADGGASFFLGSTQCFLIDSTADSRSFFSAHMRYDKEELENKGTETVAGIECTHYYYENGLMKIHMYVDETFNSTGICLKYVDEGYQIQTIEVTELKFGCINTEEGYEFSTFQSKVATEDDEA